MHFKVADLVEMLSIHQAKDGREHEFSLGSATAARIRTLRNPDGTAVWSEGPDLLLGFPVRVDPDIPDGEIRLECQTFPQDITVFREDEADA
jgi:hypothetical protein